jgi:hypothetical protein
MRTSLGALVGLTLSAMALTPASAHGLGATAVSDLSRRVQHSRIEIEPTREGPFSILTRPRPLAVEVIGALAEVQPMIEMCRRASAFGTDVEVVFASNGHIARVDVGDDPSQRWVRRCVERALHGVSVQPFGEPEFSYKLFHAIDWATRWRRAHVQAPVNPGAPVRADDVVNAFQHLRSEAASCLVPEADEVGMALATVTFTADGSVTRASVPSPFPDAINRCLTRVVTSHVRVPPFKGAPVEAQYPLEVRRASNPSAHTPAPLEADRDPANGHTAALQPPSQ